MLLKYFSYILKGYRPRIYFGGAGWGFLVEMQLLLENRNVFNEFIVHCMHIKIQIKISISFFKCNRNRYFISFDQIFITFFAICNLFYIFACKPSTLESW